MHIGRKDEDNTDADDCSQSSKEVHEQRSLPRISSVHEHTEISDFLGDFMEQHSNRRSDSQGDAHQITRSDDKSIDEIMNDISDQIHGSDRMGMCLGDRHMAVIPADDFFGDQTEEYSSQQRQGNEERQSLRRYRLRQQMEERVAKQRSRGKAHKQQKYSLQKFKLKAESDDTDKRNSAHNEYA